jgi:hypothetical protein
MRFVHRARSRDRDRAEDPSRRSRALSFLGVRHGGEGLANDVQDLVAIERLLNEVGRAALHRFHGERHGPVRGDQDDWDVRPTIHDSPQELHAVHTIHSKVGDQGIEWPRLEA